MFPFLQLLSLLLVMCGLCHANVMIGPCSDNSASTNSSGLEHFTCSLKGVDLLLGGLVALRHYDATTQTCQGFSDVNVQLVEAMRHAIDLVNANASILSNVTLGYEIRDTCRSTDHTLRQVVTNFLPHTAGGSAQCNVNMNGDDDLKPPVVGVVGSYTSSTSIRTTELLSLFRIPMISYGSTSPLLSDSKAYPYFLRTLPSDSVSGEAIAGLIRAKRWTFVGFVFSDTTYGRASVDVILEHLGLAESTCSKSQTSSTVADMCVALRRPIPDGPRGDDGLFRRVWEDLLYDEAVRRTLVVVAILQASHAQAFFEYPGNAGGALYQDALHRNITFIGSDSWGQSHHVVEGSENITRGALSLVPQSTTYLPFREHWVGLNPVRNPENPWLPKLFGCSLSRNGTNGTCSPHDRQQSDFNALIFVQFVYDAVFAFANALDALYLRCNSNLVCLKGSISQNLLATLMSTQFRGVNGKEFRFAPNGDPEVSRYTFKNIQDTNGSAIEFVSAGHFQTKHTLRQTPLETLVYRNSSSSVMEVENRIQEATKFFLDPQVVMWNDGTRKIPSSRCSADCSPGYKRTLKQTFASCYACCWTCQPCPMNYYASSENADVCQQCDVRSTSNVNRTGCEGVEISRFSATAVEGSIISALACLSLLFCCACTVQCWRKLHCFFPMGTLPTGICLFGFLLIYTAMLLEASGPTDFLCSARSVLSALGMTTVSASVFSYTCHRLSVLYPSQYSAFLLKPVGRTLLSAVVILGAVIILLIFIVSGGYPQLQQQVSDHVTIAESCSFHSVDVATSAYVIFLGLATTVQALLVVYIGSRFSKPHYVPDERGLLLVAISAASCFSVFLLGLILFLQGSTNTIWQDLLLHLGGWQFGTTFLLLVFLQQVRKLAPISDAQSLWLSELRSQYSALAAGEGSMNTDEVDGQHKSHPSQIELNEAKPATYVYSDPMANTSLAASRQQHFPPLPTDGDAHNAVASMTTQGSLHNETAL